MIVKLEELRTKHFSQIDAKLFKLTTPFISGIEGDRPRFQYISLTAMDDKPYSPKWHLTHHCYEDSRTAHRALRAAAIQAELQRVTHWLKPYKGDSVMARLKTFDKVNDGEVLGAFGPGYRGEMRCPTCHPESLRSELARVKEQILEEVEGLCLTCFNEWHGNICTKSEEEDEG
jgi:hypothetical protein